MSNKNEKQKRGRPPKEPGERSITKTISLRPEVHRMILDLVQKSKRSYSSVVEELISRV